jgi:hypothetical protein
MDWKKAHRTLRRLLIVDDERFVELDGRAMRLAFYTGVVLGVARFANELWVNGIVRMDMLSIGAAMAITWIAGMVYLGLTR